MEGSLLSLVWRGKFPRSPTARIIPSAGRLSPFCSRSAREVSEMAEMYVCDGLEDGHIVCVALIITTYCVVSRTEDCRYWHLMMMMMDGAVKTSTINEPTIGE